jgi:hypothetical protein
VPSNKTVQSIRDAFSSLHLFDARLTLVDRVRLVHTLSVMSSLNMTSCYIKLFQEGDWGAALRAMFLVPIASVVSLGLKDDA